MKNKYKEVLDSAIKMARSDSDFLTKNSWWVENYDVLRAYIETWGYIPENMPERFDDNEELFILSINKLGYIEHRVPERYKSDMAWLKRYFIPWIKLPIESNEFRDAYCDVTPLKLREEFGLNHISDSDIQYVAFKIRSLVKKVGNLTYDNLKRIAVVEASQNPNFFNINNANFKNVKAWGDDRGIVRSYLRWI